VLLEVDLSQNGLRAAGVRALGESAHLRGLVILRLGDNPINESAAATLAASPLGQRLAVLELEDAPPAPGSPPIGEDDELEDLPGPGPAPLDGDEIPC
jgi:hypothetical protein